MKDTYRVLNISDATSRLRLLNAVSLAAREQGLEADQCIQIAEDSVTFVESGGYGFAVYRVKSK